MAPARWLAALCSAAVLFAAPGAGAQERYPDKPVQLVVPYSAGGGVDVMGRAFAIELGRVLSAQFVVVNRDGAGGTIGFAQLASARPDGMTLAFSPASPMTNSPHMVKGLSYQFESIVPVCQVFENVFTVAVPPQSPIRTLAELVAAARAAPGTLRYGHSGLGSIPHLSMAALAGAAGVTMVQVPYRGDGQLVPQLVSGELDFGVPAISSIGGRGLRVLAVFSDKRHPGEPGVPTVTELGFPYIPPGLNGLYAPRGTPARILDTLEAGCEQATRSDAFRAQAQRLAQPVVFLRGADFTKRLAADYEQKGRLIRELGLRQE